MARCVALLRAVNVGGRNIIAMSALKAHFEKLGHGNPRTLLQSGNVVFETSAKNSAVIEQSLELETKKRLKLEIDYCVRTSAEWQAMMKRLPMRREAKSDPARLHVMFLKVNVLPAKITELRTKIRGRETVEGNGRELYLFYPDGMGTSKFTPALIEKTIGTRGTARNWNTVTKLAALLEA
jgi:uncharacterized protein (DUF1697 family)